MVQIIGDLVGNLAENCQFLNDPDYEWYGQWIEQAGGIEHVAQIAINSIDHRLLSLQNKTITVEK